MSASGGMASTGAGRGDLRVGRSRALARVWWAWVLRGLAALLFGAVAFLDPGIALGSLVLVYGTYAIVDGVFTLIAAARAATHHGRWVLLLLEGLAGLAVGLVALALPALAVTVWVWILAGWAIVTGALMLAAAFRLHSGHGNWLLGLGGVVSIVWGALLASFPVAAAVVLTLWLGAYAVVFGVAMIAFGMRLRSRHTGAGVRA